MKYIDADKLKCLLDAKYKDFREKAKIKGYTTLQYQYMADGIDIAEQLIDSLQQEQQDKKEVKFVFPKFLYARTKNNKTIDVSYAPQSLDAIEYIRSDFLEQEQPEVFDTVAFQKGVQEGRRLERNEPVTTCDQLRPVTDCHELEEAAETKYPTRWKKYPNDGIVRSEEYFDLNAEKRDAFKAGAEWMKTKILKDNPVIMSVEDFQALIDSHAKRVEADYREKMMGGAVEADVNIYRDLAEGESWAEFVVAKPPKNLGDKVKIIIVKEEE